MESKSCWILLVLVFGSSANKIPIDKSHPTVPPVAHPTVPPVDHPTVPPVAAAHDHNLASGDIPVDNTGQKILCNQDQDCADSVLGEFSECKGSTCYCKVNSHQSETSKKCLPVRGLGEGCEENQQCDELGSAACIRNLCTCKTGAEVIDRKCWIKKNIGDSCGLDEECKVTSKDTKCKDHTCVCKDGMVAHSDGKHCLPGATKVGDPCEETEQCTWELGGATCQKGSCKCLEDHHEKNNACIKTLYLEDKCGADLGECFLPNSFGITRVECKNTCVCKDSFVQSEDKKHCLEPGQKDPGSGGGAASVYPLMASIVTIVAALLLTS